MRGLDGGVDLGHAAALDEGDDLPAGRVSTGNWSSERSDDHLFFGQRACCMSLGHVLFLCVHGGFGSVFAPRIGSAANPRNCAGRAAAVRRAPPA